MKRNYFLALFINSLTTWLVGVSIMPLLPLYAAELGASSGATGLYLAFSFATLAAGTMLAGKVAGWLGRRRDLIVLAGLIALPTTWLMGHVSAVWQLALLTAVIWFAAGIAITLQNILMGLLAAKAKRGRMFGLLASTTALAGLIGGLFVGRIADQWGYQRLFAMLALVWVVMVLTALLLPEPKTAVALKTLPTLAAPQKFARPFRQFLLANLLVSITESAGMMGGSIAMNASGVSLTTITMLAAFQSGMGLFVQPAAGRLSDSMARKIVLTLTYVTRVLGTLALMLATSMSGFWIMAVCFTLAAAKNAVNPALVTDMAGDGELDGHMAVFTAGNWGGHVIGFALTGYAMQYLGMSTTFLLAALLPLGAALVLSHIPGGNVEETAVRPAIHSIQD